MDIFLTCFVSGAAFLLGFLLFFHPLQQNVIANRWLGVFVFTIGCAFTCTFMIKSGITISNSVIFKCLNSVQFLMAPSLYISILFFVWPDKTFQKHDLLHFIPFILYVLAEHIWQSGKGSVSTFVLIQLNGQVSFLVRDLLPFIILAYLILSYRILVRHKRNLKLVASNLHRIDLEWLLQFLFILLLAVLTWLNDALLELPLLTETTLFIYAFSIFFLAFFSIRQKAVFSFSGSDIKEITTIFEQPISEAEAASFEKPLTIPDKANPPEPVAGQLQENTPEKLKQKRLSDDQVLVLSSLLTSLMENDKLFLDNDLKLPAVADKLGISIHDASFLINATTQDNFYNFVNRYRVEEAKRLLASPKTAEFNILGIAYAAGFNYKTTFNTTFKKIVGISPSQYIKEQKNK